MNSSSLSAEDLRTCAFVSLICPMRSWRQGLRKLRPARLLLWSNQLTGECDLRLGSPFGGSLLPRFPAIGNTCFPHAGHSSRHPSNRRLSFSCNWPERTFRTSKPRVRCNTG